MNVFSDLIPMETQAARRVAEISLRSYIHRQAQRGYKIDLIDAIQFLQRFHSRTEFSPEHLSKFALEVMASGEGNSILAKGRKDGLTAGEGKDGEDMTYPLTCLECRLSD